MNEHASTQADQSRNNANCQTEEQQQQVNHVVTHNKRWDLRTNRFRSLCLITHQFAGWRKSQLKKLKLSNSVTKIPASPK